MPSNTERINAEKELDSFIKRIEAQQQYLLSIYNVDCNNDINDFIATIVDANHSDRLSYAVSLSFILKAAQTLGNRLKRLSPDLYKTCAVDFKQLGCEIIDLQVKLNLGMN